MTIGMLVAGIGCLLAGLLAIGFGIPINEFGLGNTLILAGAVTACTGLIILSLWVAVGELKSIAGRLGTGPDLNWKDNSSPAEALPRQIAEGNGVNPAGGEQGLDEAGVSPAPEPPSAKPRRNLMFSSTSRRERERAQARAGDPSVMEPDPSAAA